MGRSRDGAFRTEVAGWAIEIRVNSQETVIDLVPKAGNEVTGRHRARLPHGLR
jgi:acetyl/propionyl-CoA carboxylase alpha subunit